jgi:hypothetical protein
LDFLINIFSGMESINVIASITQQVSNVSAACHSITTDLGQEQRQEMQMNALVIFF